jgi:putative ABC transport system permease protein
MIRHFRFTLRTFRRQPGAYGFAIAVLALAIGICTAVFSLVDAVLLKPLPFPDQNALEVIWKTDAKAGSPIVELAYPELGDLETVPAFSSVAVMPTTLYGYGKIIQFEGRAPVQVESTPVSNTFFHTLGVAPSIGRDFAPSDEHPGATPVVILSDIVWRTQFNADRAIAGRVVTMNGIGYRVIGVMGRGVDFPRGVGVWVPLNVEPFTVSRGATYLQAIARLKPGYSHEQAEVEANSLFQAIANHYPHFYTPSQRAVVTQLPRYWAGSSRLQLILSMAAALLLLLTASITAGNLFLSRAVARTQEMATRSSLGAGPRQIAAQLIVEGLTASAIAGLLGAAIAAFLVRFLIALAPPDIPRLSEAAVNAPVLLFVAMVSLLPALACSAAPILVATRADIETLLRAGSGRLTGSRTSRRLQNMFTAGQTAATYILLTASVLIVLSVHAMLTVDTGFSHPETVTANLALRGPGYDHEHRIAFVTRLMDRLRSSSGVASAAGILLRPLEGTIGWEMHYRAPFNRDRRPEELPATNFEVVTPGYFETVGIPILQGRDSNSGDKADGARTAIISRSLAGRFRNAGLDPIGQRIQLGRDPGEDYLRIVGVAGDTRDRDVTVTADEVYVPYLQTGVPVNYLVVRGPGAREAIQNTVAALDPTQTVASVQTISELISRDTARQRFNMALLLTFGAGALLLAAAGVAGVVAESVSVREREIGVRLALGANRRALVRNLIVTTIRFVVAGEALGLIASLLLGPHVSDLLYAVQPADPRALISVASFIFFVSLCAASVPAWIATRKELNTVLR